MRRWFVVQTQARREDQAVHHLRRQDYDVYLPRYMKRRRHARRVDWHPAPLFPRYLFVKLDPEADQWRTIHSTVGVSQFITFGEAPVAVPVGIVEDIRAREDERGMIGLGSVDKFRRGDSVQVVDGAFADLNGVFDCIDDKQRVFIVLELLGRKVKVRLPIDAIYACA